MSASHNWPFAPLQPNRYGVILADPPWRFRTWSETNQAKSPSRHYGVMTLDELKALPVADLAARDCALVLWATQAMIPQALELMDAWSFAYKTFGAWAKQSKRGAKWAFGTGYVYRSAAEFYILGTRGKPSPAARDVRNLIVAPVRQHSRKPDQMCADLERLFPDVARAELFARQSRLGWDTWGLESDKFDGERAA